MNNQTKTIAFPFSHRPLTIKWAILLSFSFLFLSLPQEANAQFEAVDVSLNGVGIGGTKGYRLRRIGADNASASVNPSYNYYPASSIKVLQHFFAMSRVENSNGTMNFSAGCSAFTEDLVTRQH